MILEGFGAATRLPWGLRIDPENHPGRFTSAETPPGVRGRGDIVRDGQLVEGDAHPVEVHPGSTRALSCAPTGSMVR